VAVVAIDAVVDVSPNSLVPGIGLWLEMAVGALEDGIVAGIRMARCAHPVSTSMVQGEEGVVESRTQPAGRAVTGLASRREPGGSVGRIGCALVIRFVTGITVSRSVTEAVVDVATGAGHLRVGSG